MAKRSLQQITDKVRGSLIGGAIGGNIIGAKLGYRGIPDCYKDNIELKDVILELSDDLATGVHIDKKPIPLPRNGLINTVI